jgi:cephalosporin-C deacetylase-like acetyl esterase
MMRRLLPLLLLLGCATGSPAPTPASGGPTGAGASYATRFPDAQGPLDVQVLSSSQHGPVSVVELTYRGAAGKAPVRATLVRPAVEGKGRVGILWVHWLGEPGTTNRTEFLDEAIQLAPAGVVSLLVDTLWSAPQWYERRVMDEDPAAFTTQVLDLRRGLALLTSQPDVDPGRLGLVGHDFGAMTGMLAGAADGRPRVYVLLALTPEFENWMFYLKDKRPTDEAEYRKQLAALDPIDALPALRAPALLQVAEKDFYVPPEQISAWRRAVSGHGELRTYPTGHGMEGPVVRTDRQAWLASHLGFSAPPAP